MHLVKSCMTEMVKCKVAVQTGTVVPALRKRQATGVSMGHMKDTAKSAQIYPSIDEDDGAGRMLCGICKLDCGLQVDTNPFPDMYTCPQSMIVQS